VSSLENHIGTAVKSRKECGSACGCGDSLERTASQQRLRGNESPQRLLWKCMRSHAVEVTGGENGESSFCYENLLRKQHRKNRQNG